MVDIQLPPKSGICRPCLLDSGLHLLRPDERGAWLCSFDDLSLRGSDEKQSPWRLVALDRKPASSQYISLAASISSDGRYLAGWEAGLVVAEVVPEATH
jgi:hypothetical protein